MLDNCQGPGLRTKILALGQMHQGFRVPANFDPVTNRTTLCEATKSLLWGMMHRKLCTVKTLQQLELAPARMPRNGSSLNLLEDEENMEMLLAREPTCQIESTHIEDDFDELNLFEYMQQEYTEQDSSDDEFRDLFDDEEEEAYEEVDMMTWSNLMQEAERNDLPLCDALTPTSAATDKEMLLCYQDDANTTKVTVTAIMKEDMIMI